jgi:Protein of unknown function (DUF3489)
MNRHARINRRKDKYQMKTNADATTTTEAAAVAEQGATTAPEQATTKGKTSKTKDAPKAKKTASKPATKKEAKPAATKKASKKEAKPAPAARKTPKAKGTATTPREGSKKQIVLDLLRRKDGATMAEIAKATDWQAHSIRGFISGNLTKKMGLVVESSKNEAGERTYRIATK